MTHSDSNSPAYFWRRVTRIGPHAGAHRAAARAGVAMAVPLLLLWWFDRTEWTLYAAFGAFTALYGRNDAAWARVRHQVVPAAVFIACVVAGTVVALSEHRAWWAVPVAALIGALATVLSDVERWHPPGALFPVFAFAACASVPAVASDVAVAAVVVTASAGFSLVVTATLAWWRSGHPGDRRLPGRRKDSARHTPTLLSAARTATGCLVAGLLATLLDVGYPYWAMVAAVMPLVARDLPTLWERGFLRLAGTLAGLVIAAGILAVGPSGLGLVALVVLLHVAAEFLIGRNYALAMLVVTPVALLMVQMVRPVAASDLLLHRGAETLLGVSVALVVGLITLPRGPRSVTRPG